MLTNFNLESAHCVGEVMGVFLSTPVPVGLTCKRGMITSIVDKDFLCEMNVWYIMLMLASVIN